MGKRDRFTVGLCGFLVVAATGVAGAQPAGAPAEPSSEPTPSVKEEGEQPKKPRRGDFDGGGRMRLPSGPDEMGEFATWNWVAVDLRGSYNLLDSVQVRGEAPLAIIHPDDIGGGVEPRMLGGMSVTLDARMPEMPWKPVDYQYELSLLFTGSYMREGAMLLSEKDFPLFVGGFQPGLSTGVVTKIQLSSLVDFSLAPVFVFQSGEADNLTAVQIPTSTILELGSLVKLSADLGVFTGDDYSFSGDDGGRITAGGALDVKVGPIIVHGGAGFASLLTGGLYPTIGDSVYIDLNVKYAK